MPRYVLDTCALLSYLLDEQEADTMENLLTRAKNKEISLWMSVIQFGEVFYILEKYVSDVNAKEALKAEIRSLPIKPVPADLESAITASEFKAKGGIAYPDCFVIATALRLLATIVTKDAEFKKFEKEVKILWLGAQHYTE